MTPTIERLEHIPNTVVGEGPHWDEDTQCLFFVDIFGNNIHKYVPITKKHTQASVNTVTPGEETSIFYSMSRYIIEKKRTSEIFPRFF